MYPKYFHYELLILFQICLLYFCSCDLEHLAEGQSQLGLVYIANADELEFQLKDRAFNDSVKIEPTRTVIMNKNGQFETTEEVGADNINTEIFGVVWDKNPVPTVNTFYLFDQNAVKILLDFVKLPENVQKLSQKHLQRIKKFVFEWFELIQEPTNEEYERTNEDSEIPNNHIPKSMSFQDIVLRNILRVQVDLQKIMDYSNDKVWKEQIVDKIIEAEALNGFDIFQEGEVESVSSSLAQLSGTYNLHPFELYPHILDKGDSLLSYVHAALYTFFRQHVTVALEWFEAAKSLLKDDVSNVWKDIHSQNENLPKSLQTEEKYWLKLKTMRENYEREKRDFVKKEIAKLERIFPGKENSEDQKDSECRKSEYKKEKMDYVYLEILNNISANTHEEIFNGNDILMFYGSFLKSLKEESVYIQSRKETKENYLRKMPKITYDLDVKIKQETLCRGIVSKSAKEMSMYSCRLDSRNSPYLLLMPVKVEELNKNPEVLILHHIVGDKKIHEFQQLALPIAAISRTGGAIKTASVREAMMHRKSYVAWIHEHSSRKLATMNHLISHLTGYVASEVSNGSESLQVNSYVSGGFYGPHQDPFDVFENFFDSENKLIGQYEADYYEKHSGGDRLATIMIYMNDDMIGGRTIFPHLGVSVAPEKGSAIYWTNLHLNGTVHEHALHAGCQVLAGTKWVSNKWIRSNSQMFRRPCALERNM